MTQKLMVSFLKLIIEGIKKYLAQFQIKLSNKVSNTIKMMGCHYEKLILTCPPLIGAE